MNVSYQFLPWARAGAAGGITRTDTLDASLPARVELPVSLRVNQRADVDVALSVLGPGDVTGIDTLQIVRTDPAPYTTDAESNYFPSVEFDRPDFPWLFTPAAADVQGRLRPWLCLVAVRRQEGVEVRFTPDRPLPILHIASPANPAVELPDLSDSWAWCHSQVVTSDDGPSVLEHLSRDTEQTVSRLLCPRRLEPNARYLACLVPAFAVGVSAGLGLQIDDQTNGTLEPAWQSGDQAPSQIALPIYHQWEFATGAGGDFESLVRLLTGRPLPDGVGSRPMTANDLGLDLPDAGTLRFDGALTAPSMAAPPAAPGAFRAALETVLDQPAARSSNDDGPIVAPPIYGSRHASQLRVGATAGWLRDMNLHPVTRAVAGLGTLVVQDQQEQLMAAAWEQLGEFARERRLLEQPRFARAILDSVYRRRFGILKPTQLFQLTAPAHGRLLLSAGVASAVVGRAGTAAVAPHRTVGLVLGNSPLPAAMTSAALRKVTRPQGQIFRKINRGRTRPAAHALMQNGQAILLGFLGRRPPRPVGDSVTRQLVRGHVARLRGVLAPGLPPGAPGVKRQRDILTRMTNAVDAVRAYYDDAIRDRSIQAPAPIDLPPLKADLLRQLNPAGTRSASFGTSVGAAPRADTSDGDAAETIEGPSFPRPMYAALRDLSQEYLLPGAEKIPRDTVTLLETNARFVEAYLVGLNHEMSRELLWREYPSDQRHTSFRHFWDDGGRLPQIPELHHWEVADALGAHFMGGAASGQLVLLIRGELLQRYPNTQVHAVRARSRNELGSEQKTPLFAGTLKPDMTFVGFDLSVDEARGTGTDPGWFFLIEQQPTEPRFGLDQPGTFGRDPAAIGSWNDLSWGDLVDDEAQFETLSHAALDGRLNGKAIGSVAWARNGGHMAGVMLQRPVRVAMHAVDLLDGAA